MPRTISPRVLWRKLYPMESLGQWKLMWRARGRAVTFEEQNSVVGALVQAFANDAYTHLRFQDVTGADGSVVLTMPDGEYWCRATKVNFDVRNMGKKTVAGDDKTVEFTMVPIEANEVTLTGSESVKTDNVPKEETYEIELDEELVGVPVVITTTFLEADIDAVDAGDVTDLVGEGIEVLTDAEGKASIAITFSDAVDKTANVVATISDTELHVATGGDTSTLAVVVDTSTKIANGFTAFAGPELVEADNDTAAGEYIATLDEEWAGFPVVFTTDFVADDIDHIIVSGEGTVEDLVGAGLTVLTDDQGMADLYIMFAADVDKSAVEIRADISDTEDSIGTSAFETIDVTVDTTYKTTSNVTMAGEQTIASNNTPVTETYEATIDTAIEGVPVTIHASALAEGHVDAVDPGTVEAFVDPETGVEVLTDAGGKASISVTFAAAVDEVTNIVAAIDDTHERVAVTDSDGLEVTIDTTEDL